MAGHYSIVLADAHSRFRREMRKILEEHPDLKVAGEAGNRQELFEILSQAQPSMVILDVSMPDLRAREGTRLIKMHYPQVKVLITVMDQEPEYFSQGLAAGAEGVLPKQYVAGQIFRAIAVVRQGQLYIPPRISGDSWESSRTAIGDEHYGFDHCQVLIPKGKQAVLRIDLMNKKSFNGVMVNSVSALRMQRPLSHSRKQTRSRPMARYDILLVGDDTNLLRTIGWVLEYKGFAVKATSSPEAALEALVKKNYDLVIGKLSADDREVLDILERAQRLNPDVKVMVISANGETSFPLSAYEVEIDDYILMPVSPTELWRRVTQCLEGQEVLDLQPLRLPVDLGLEPNKDKPQTMLMLHDLRGAMVSTAAAMKLMVRGTYGGMSEGARSRLEEVSGRVENLINLTDEFLGKALATSHWPGEKKGASLDLRGDIVEPVLAELASDLRDHRITLINRLPDRLEGKIPVRGSKPWLKSVFRNLINNGIKYGGNGCTIVVDFETQGSNCQLNVYNTGKTVPAAYRSMLFSQGAEMRRSQKGRSGLGLGLSLSRDILQNYGGDIWYEPTSDGSNFVVSLPQ